VGVLAVAYPYFIEGPAMVSFSGGRTSAYMLHEILQAHGGVLPPDVHVNFANTGKEREETLRFVHECGSRWNVRINWVEFRDNSAGFDLVGLNSASRNGEPFQAMIDKKKRLPNWKERWCTDRLKVQPMTDFAASLGLAPGDYAEVIGLRYDEGLRIFKGMENADKRGRKILYPLAKAKVTKANVKAFWGAQPFDLGLEPWEGNCDLCFLKGRAIKKRILRADPSRAAWWAANESAHKGKQERGWFDKRDSINGLLNEVRRSPELFETIDAEEYDVECGLHCSPEMEAAE
jgi:3'-phosphoadenosine 5'-phosphosulfate sulfotransferase (PAPS reductase)/FAD synthetase